MADAASVPSDSLKDTTTGKTRKPKRKLLWIVGIIVLGLMAVAIFLPSLCRAREPANRVKCASNLRQIGQAILLYSKENNGQFGPSLADLLAKEDITADVMVCPSSNDGKPISANTAGIAAMRSRSTIQF